MTTSELEIFRKWIRAEIAANESPIYQNKARAEALYQQLLRACDDVKPEESKQ